MNELIRRGYNTSQAIDMKDRMKIHIKLAKPSRINFHVVDEFIPVSEKKYSGHDGPTTNYESAASRLFF